MGCARGMMKKRCVLLAMCMVLKMTGQKKYPRLSMVRSVGDLGKLRKLKMRYVIEPFASRKITKTMAAMRQPLLSFFVGGVSGSYGRAIKYQLGYLYRMCFLRFWPLNVMVLPLMY